MRKAFTMLELVFIVVMLGILASAAMVYIPRDNLKVASEILINNIKYAKTLAQTDDRFFTMGDNSVAGSVNINQQMEFWQAGLWQVQFHLTGQNTQNSYSIYADTGRSGSTTNFDGRPMAGDIIAKDPMNKACLSGYSKTNLPSECADNISKDVRLEETYGVRLELAEIQADCKESNQTFRVYFDNKGMPYCGKPNLTDKTKPVLKALTLPIKIVLREKNQVATICISKSGLIYGANPKQGQTIADCDQ